MATLDPDLNTVPPSTAAVPPADIGKVNVPPDDSYGPEPDVQYWLQCLEDAERAERDWRKRGREIIQIYRNEAKTTTRKGTAGVTYNILYANTEVMLPATYMKPPDPVVRSRFANVKPPMPPTPMGLPGVPPGIAPPMPAGGPPPAAPMAGPAAPPPGMPLPPGGGAGPIVVPPNGSAGPAVPPPPAMPPAPAGVAAEAGAVPPGLIPPADAAPALAGLPAPAMPMPPPPPMGLPAVPPGPDPADVETAAAVMEKALEIVVDDEQSHEAIKTAIKDMLLPGRGVCRVRWRPEMETVPMPGGPLPDGTAPTEQRKVWEQVGDEYVYWEDFLCDPVRQAADCGWVAFRHLFTKQQLLGEFGNSPELMKLQAEGKLGELLKWTEESAAKNPVGGGSPMKTADKLGDHVRKAMAWEIWDKANRRIIWFCRDASGIVLRIDPDTYRLQGFFPIPIPLLAVVTSDSRIPRAYYDLYAKMAEDLDRLSQRISNLTDQVKVRGAYNSASNDIADILKADDGKMIGIDGVDMLNGGLQNHIWLVPIADFMAALDKLFLARDQLKNSIYEVMGISDIMRGATKASETATAQRIKGSMGVTRLEDAKQQVGNFVRDLLRLKAELIAQNFDASTLSEMTGEEVTPAVEAILRDDFQRTCNIDIEADSTVAVDEQAEQQSMAMVMQSVQAVMMGTQAMLQSGILPPNQVVQLGLELLKMFLHPVRFSRGVVEMINTFQDQLAMMPLMPPPPPALPPPGPPQAAGGKGPPQPSSNGGGPPQPNGAAPPPNLAQPPGRPPLVA